jgi:prepilin-type processing-associated H-X9-DG protein
MKWTAIRHPSKALTFLDEDAMSIDEGLFLYSSKFDEWLNIPARRHQNGCVLTFADGHSEYWKWKGPAPNASYFNGGHVSDALELQDLKRFQQTAPNVEWSLRLRHGNGARTTCLLFWHAKESILTISVALVLATLVHNVLLVYFLTRKPVKQAMGVTRLALLELEKRLSSGASTNASAFAMAHGQFGGGEDGGHFSSSFGMETVTENQTW